MTTFKKAVSIAQWTHKPITLKMLDLDRILMSPYAYEQGLVKMIGEDGKQHTLETVGDYAKASHKNVTIKIEGMERLNRMMFDITNKAARGVLHDGPVSCHCFIAKRMAPSFPNHQDPDGVMIYVVEGTKLLHVGGEEHWLRTGATITLAPDVMHRAENREASVMLSFGFEKFMTEKLNA